MINIVEVKAALRILGLGQDTTLSQVRNSFRRLYSAHHPKHYSDPARKADAEARITDLYRSYLILKRLKYPLDQNQFVDTRGAVVGLEDLEAALGPKPEEAEEPAKAAAFLKKIGLPAAIVLSAAAFRFMEFAQPFFTKFLVFCAAALCGFYIILSFLSRIFGERFFQEGETVPRISWFYGLAALAVPVALSFDHSYLFGHEYLILTAFAALILVVGVFAAETVHEMRVGRIGTAACIISLVSGLVAGGIALLSTVPKRIKTESLPVLSKALAKDSRRTKVRAINALGALGSKAWDVAGSLKTLSQSPDPAIRAASSSALAKIQDDVQAVIVSGLVRRLRDSNDKTRIEAAGKLADLGPLAVSAMPALNLALQDRNPEVSKQVYAAMVKIDPNMQARPIFNSNYPIKDLNENEAMTAVMSLSQTLESSPQSIKDLVEALDHLSEKVKALSLKALDAAGEKAKAAKDKVKLLTQDPSPEVRYRAALVLSNFELPGASLVPTLVEGLASEDSQVRFRSAFVLGDMGRKARAAVPEIKKLVFDSDEQVRMAGVVALEKIGPGLPAPAKKAARKPAKKVRRKPVKS